MPVWLDALAHRVRRQADLVAGAAAAAETAHLAMPAAAGKSTKCAESWRR